MMVLDAQKLALFLQSQAPVHHAMIDNTNLIANRLIKERQIQPGFGLAGFLSVDRGVDNFTAVRAWVNRQLIKLQQEDSDMGGLYEEIAHRFYHCLPDLIEG